LDFINFILSRRREVGLKPDAFVKTVQNGNKPECLDDATLASL